MPRYSLTGKVAMVTGGARGIGLATARRLSERGATVAVVDLRAEDAERAAASVNDRAMGLAADVTDRGALQRAVAQVVERHGGLDVVVANAGIISRAATMRAMAPESARRVLDVNLNGVFETVDVALGEIVRRRGHVVVISSIYAFMNGSGAIPYAMSKAAVEALGRALRVELAPHGASATVAYFGFIDTEMVHRSLDEDELATQVVARLPKALRDRIAPEQAAAGIVRGIERRRPRVIRPRRWAALSVLRGAVNPMLDAAMERDATLRESVATLDARAGEEQPTTA